MSGCIDVRSCFYLSLDTSSLAQVSIKRGALSELFVIMSFVDLIASDNCYCLYDACLCWYYLIKLNLTNFLMLQELIFPFLTSNSRLSGGFVITVVIDICEILQRGCIDTHIEMTACGLMKSWAPKGRTCLFEIEPRIFLLLDSSAIRCSTMWPDDKQFSKNIYLNCFKCFV